MAMFLMVTEFALNFLAAHLVVVEAVTEVGVGVGVDMEEGGSFALGGAISCWCQGFLQQDPGKM